ncbi:MAG: hypothetical protein COW02_07645 [Comamonadaceae bacterium CG12_big_fil_rev_8_21_14_0_65_59_15]|nr:MAG: hypothetical protein COW02_07645 [Comamonadaceae bacterium CG12_big_fil_rev_8_21_14_0_65_59_15]
MANWVSCIKEARRLRDIFCADGGQTEGKFSHMPKKIHIACSTRGCSGSDLQVCKIGIEFFVEQYPEPKSHRLSTTKFFNAPGQNQSQTLQSRRQPGVVWMRGGNDHVLPNGGEGWTDMFSASLQAGKWRFGGKHALDRWCHPGTVVALLYRDL